MYNNREIETNNVKLNIALMTGPNIVEQYAHVPQVPTHIEMEPKPNFYRNNNNTFSQLAVTEPSTDTNQLLSSSSNPWLINSSPQVGILSNNNASGSESVTNISPELVSAESEESELVSGPSEAQIHQDNRMLPLKYKVACDNDITSTDITDHDKVFFDITDNNSKKNKLVLNTNNVETNVALQVKEFEKKIKFAISLITAHEKFIDTRKNCRDVIYKEEISSKTWVPSWFRSTDAADNCVEYQSACHDVNTTIRELKNIKLLLKSYKNQLNFWTKEQKQFAPGMSTTGRIFQATGFVAASVLAVKALNLTPPVMAN